jgi:HPt (histidine-containing phosphotransfer) domain-containing protein
MEGFEALQVMYRQALPEKRAALEKEWHALAAGAPPEAHAQVLHRQLHNLSGSGGAYGFDAMGEMARQLEKRWVQWLASPPPRGDAAILCAELGPLFHTLLAALDAAALPLDQSPA